MSKDLGKSKLVGVVVNSRIDILASSKLFIKPETNSSSSRLQRRVRLICDKALVASKARKLMSYGNNEYCVLVKHFRSPSSLAKFLHP